MKERPQDLFSDSAGAGLGAFGGGVSTVAGVDPSTVLALSTAGAALGPFFAAALRRGAAAIAHRLPVVTEAAEVRAGLSEDDLAARIESDPELQPLVQRILEATTRTENKRKLQILGTVLGEAVDDRPRALDESILIVETVDALQPVHIRVLEALEREPENVPEGHAQVWTGDFLEAAIKDASGLGVQGAVAGLVGRGLASSRTGLGGVTVFGLSEYGRAMLSVIRESIPGDIEPARTGPQRAPASEDTDRSVAAKPPP